MVGATGCRPDTFQTEFEQFSRKPVCQQTTTKRTYKLPSPRAWANLMGTNSRIANSMNKAKFCALALTSIGLSSQVAFADVAGRYENTDKNAVLDLEMTIEADDAGDVRVQMAKTGTYYLFRDATLYLVTMNGEDTTVMKVSDVFAVQQEALAQMRMKMPPMPPSPPEVRFAPMEEVTVAGRKGTAFGMVSAEHEKPVYGSIVISADPKFGALGRAIARVNTSQIKGMGSMGQMLQMMNTEMLALLQRGAPLRMLSIELTDVSFDNIPAGRFALPTEPLSINEIRAQLIKPTVPPPPTLPPRAKLEAKQP